MLLLSRYFVLETDGFFYMIHLLACCLLRSFSIMAAVLADDVGWLPTLKMLSQGVGCHGLPAKLDIWPSALL